MRRYRERGGVTSTVRNRARWLGMILGVVLGVYVLPASANAIAVHSIEIRVESEDITPNARMHLPVYFVENRGAADKSFFSGNQGRLRGFNTIFSTTQSTIVGFTPNSAFDSRAQYQYENRTYHAEGVNYLLLTLTSTGGVPVSIDNTGTTGRTEVLVGMIDIDVGATIPLTETLDLVMQVSTSDDNSAASSASAYIDGTSGYTFGPKMAARALRWYRSPSPEPPTPPTPPDTPGDVPGPTGSGTPGGTGTPGPGTSTGTTGATAAALAQATVGAPTAAWAAKAASTGIAVTVRPAKANGVALARMTVPGRLLGLKKNTPVVVGTTRKNVTKGVRATLTVKPVPKWRAKVGALKGKKVRILVAFRGKTTTKVITLR